MHDPSDMLLPLGPTFHETQEYRDLITESAKRKIESLRLYEPSEFQRRFHESCAKERAIVAGNQVGKSLAAFIEDARAVTGTDPYEKYPKNDGVLVCLGLDEAHIGRVIHKYLFRAGSFRIIRDEETQEWRAWKPWLPGDMERKSEAKMAPPLIPPRMVKSMAWKKRSTYVFELAELHTGWTIYAMSSKGEPAAGFQADLIHIDEDIERPEWYDEMIARLSMRDGRLIWSALPMAKNNALVNLLDRADDEAKDENPSTVAMRATIFDNPFMPENVKDENIKRWKAQGDDVYRQRALGEMTINSVLMYPTFTLDVHNAVRPEPQNRLMELMLETNGQPLRDWCRYMVVDPGHTVCAVTFWATPPPEVGDYRLCYDECYIRNCNATLFGEHVIPKLRDQTWQAFIIDAHGGRLRDIGSGVTPRRQYEAQLELGRIECEAVGSRFVDGSDDIPGREMVLREWMNIRRDGSPKFYVVAERCPNLVREFKRFKRRVIRGVIQDSGNRSGECHAVETAEYAAAHGLDYIRPPVRHKQNSGVARILAERKRREQQRRVSVFSPEQAQGVSLGPRGAS